MGSSNCSASGFLYQVALKDAIFSDAEASSAAKTYTNEIGMEERNASISLFEGVQGPPCRGLGCPQKFSFFLGPAAGGARATSEELLKTCIRIEENRK